VDGAVVVLKTDVDVTTPVRSLVVVSPILVVVTITPAVVSSAMVVVDAGSGVVIGSGVVMVMLYGAQKQHDPGTSMNRCPRSSQSS